MDFFGLPLHPLVVHAAVVLVPLAGLGALAVVLSSRLRARYGWLVAGFGVAGAASALAARLSGPVLLEQMSIGGPAIMTHQNWGLLTPYPAIVLAVSVPALMLVDRRRSDGRSAGAAFWLAAALTVAAALVGLVLIALTGHSGAVAVWGS